MLKYQKRIKYLPLVVFAVAAAFAGNAYARWTRVDSGTLAWLYSVHFLDERNGWIAGSRGTLLRSKDSGITWKQSKRFTEDNIRDVYFSDPDNGWLLCDRPNRLNDGKPASYFLRTSDGGTSWERIDLKDTRDRLVRLFFSKDGEGFAVGEGAGLWRLSDDRRSWRRVPLPVRYLMMGGRLIDESNGVLVGGGGTVLFTIDGGSQWGVAALSEKTDKRFNSVFFINRTTGWTVGAGGSVYVTTDEGRIWRAQRSEVTLDLFDVSFSDMNRGYAVGDLGTIIRTADGGNTWIPDDSGTEGKLERVVLVGKKIFAIGYGGVILTKEINS